MSPTPAGPARRLIKAEPTTLIWSEPLPDGGSAVVKVYRHKALHDALRRWFVPYRTEREFRLLARLHAHGIACTEPLRWSHGRDRAHGRHELLATREISGVVPLAQALRDSRGAAPADLAPLFALARRMHDAGVAHGAFYPANILVSGPSGGPYTFYLSDFAHGCLFASGITGTRPADFDLLDMLRAIDRLRPLAGCEAWLAGYDADGNVISRLMKRFERHRLERPWRHMRRAETDARAAWDAIKGGKRMPGRPASDHSVRRRR